MTVTESIEIAASPETVYDLVSDVSRMGEWSPEATGARRATRILGVGDTFVGTNRRGPWRWYTQCRVVAADRGREFTFLVDVGPMPVSRWSYRFEPTATGCTVEETWEDRRSGALGGLVEKVGRVIIPGPREDHNRANMRATLAALKQAAEVS